ncbi:MAG: cold shock domain-containing protein [Hydrogenophaga sp.]|nr:cold shock domain-containing protein [Hydrogenophaga sp.]
MPQSGTLKVWNEDRGFGFVKPADGSADVFVHVSALPREGPRPLVGEALLFEVEPGRDGKLRAVRVRRPGQTLREAAPTALRPARRPARRPPERSPLKGLMTLVLAGIVAVFGYTQYNAWQRARAVQAPPLSSPTQALAPQAPASAASPFNCDGRTHCSQMTSCQEAKYFLAHCPGVKMDGNNDGVPCEQQWCH